MRRELISRLSHNSDLNGKHRILSQNGIKKVHTAKQYEPLN